jgi:CheY-like chemotaxis protein
MFEIKLPKTKKPSDPEVDGIGSPGDVSGARILVVDDNKTARDSLVSVFTDLGCIVTQASSAEEALEYDDLTKFDFAVIDYMLSEQSDYTGCDLIRDLGIRDSRVCVVTGTNHPSILREISNKYALYRKPLDSQQFGDLVARIGRIRHSDRG